jgi:hypothetical protein
MFSLFDDYSREGRIVKFLGFIKILYQSSSIDFNINKKKYNLPK